MNRLQATLTSIAALALVSGPVSAQVWKIGNWDAAAAPASSAEPAPDPPEAPTADPAPAALESASEDHGPKAGEFEFTLGGSGVNNNDFDAGSFGINASLGFFLADPLEISVRQTIIYADDSGANDDNKTWIGFSRVALDFHFEIGAFVPFIGANAGIVYGDQVDETFELAPEAGIKIYALAKTFIFAMVEYQFFFTDTDDADDAFDDGQFVYTLGIGFNFF